MNQKFLKIAVFVIILGFYASFLLVKIHLTESDNDAGLYISDGKIILQTHDVFKANPYSYVQTNFRVVNHHWLSSVVFYLVSAIVGFKGLTIFKTIILLSAFSVLFVAAMKKADFWLVAIFSLPTILILSYRTRIRPEMFSYLFIALFLYLLFDLEEHPESKRFFWLIPLQILWVNFHIYFFIGLVLVAGFLIEKIILSLPASFRGKFRWKNYKNLQWNPAAKKLLMILPILIAVCFVNPSGVLGALAPLRSHSYATFVVSENQPLFNFKNSFLSWNIFGSPFGYMVIIFLISLIPHLFLKKGAGSIFLFLAGIGSAGAGIIHVRLMTLFAVIFLLAVPANFNGIFLKTKDWLLRKWRRAAIVLGYVSAVIIAAAFPYKVFNMNASGASQGYPTDWGIGLDGHSNDAGDFFTQHNLKGPIFNDYDIGGYIIYHVFPKEKIFVDNNGADSYPVSFFDDIFMPMLQQEEKWQETQDKYKINSIFISFRDGSPSVANFLLRRLHDPLWALVHADTYAVILLKNVPENQEIIRNFQITPENIEEKINNLLKSNNVIDRVMAGRLLYFMGREDLSTSVLKKVVAQYPKNNWVWLYMGSLKTMKDDPQSLISAIIFLENAIDMGQKTSEGYTWLGLAYFKFGQFKKAENAFQEALRLDPGRQDTTNYLNQLQSYLNQAQTSK